MLSELLVRARWICLIGVVSLLVAALAAFVWGAIKTFGVVFKVILREPGGGDVTVGLVSCADTFLVATALLLLAFGLYELCIGRLALPEALSVGSFQALKVKLSGVMVLVMAVRFLDLLYAGGDPAAMLYTAGGVALVSSVLIAFTAIGKSDKSDAPEKDAAGS